MQKYMDHIVPAVTAAIVAALAIAGMLLMTGCAQLAGVTPSFEYCSEVKVVSDRVGNNIDLNIKAKCALPIGGKLPGM